MRRAVPGFRTQTPATGDRNSVFIERILDGAECVVVTTDTGGDTGAAAMEEVA